MLLHEPLALSESHLPDAPLRRFWHDLRPCHPFRLVVSQSTRRSALDCVPAASARVAGVLATQYTAALRAFLALASSLFLLPSASLALTPVHRTAAAHTDLYGDPLPQGATARLGTTRFRYGAVVAELSYALNGQTLASSDKSCSISLWGIPSGRTLLRIGVPERVLLLQRLLPDGKSIAVLKDGRGKIFLWDFLSRRESKPSLVPHPNAICSRPGDDMEEFSLFAVSSNGKLLAGATTGRLERPRLIEVWELETGKELTELRVVRRFSRSHHRIEWLAFSVDGRRLYSAGSDSARRDHSIIRWDLNEDSPKATLHVPRWSGNFNKAIAIAADGRTIAHGAGTKISIWDADRGAHVRDMPTSGADVICLSFSPNGSRLAGAGRDGTVRVWDVRGAKEPLSLQGHESWVETVAFSTDGRLLASGSQDRTVRIWDTETGRELSPQGGHTADITGAAFTPDGRTIITSGSDGNVIWWDAYTGKQLRDAKLAQHAGCSALALTPDGKILAVGTATGQLAVFDAQLARQTRYFECGTSAIALSKFSADGLRLVTAGENVPVRLWHVPAWGPKVHRFPGISWHGAALSPSGKTLAVQTAPANGIVDVELHDADTGRVVQRLPGLIGPDIVLAFTPDGQLLATGGRSLEPRFPGIAGEPPPDYGDALRLWDVTSGHEVRRCHGELSSLWNGSRCVIGLAFSPDGKMLISSESERRFIAYETATGRPHFEILERPEAIAESDNGTLAVAFSPEGRRLAVSGSDNAMIVWDIAASEGPSLCSPANFARIWSDLSSSDSTRAWGAMKELYAAPQDAAHFLSEYLRPVRTKLAPIPELIADLDSDQFDVRARAATGLEKLGPAAIPALESALARSPSPTARHQLEDVLEKARAGRLPADDLRSLRATEVLEHLALPAAQTILETLAAGTPGARLTREAKAALGRLH